MSSLFDQNGKRKYLTVEERRAFLQSAKQRAPEVYSFCITLAYTGARITEVLSLVPARFDLAEGVIVIQSLKKRGKILNRAVPVPIPILIELDQIHQIVDKQQNGGTAMRLWPWGRTTGWKHVKCVMAEIGVSGPSACPRGLRHSFGVSAVQSQTPVNMVRKWLGHARLETTAIYTDAIGNEERDIAQLFWKTF